MLLLFLQRAVYQKIVAMRAIYQNPKVLTIKDALAAMSLYHGLTMKYTI